jgi:hypothetical protein
VLRLDDLWADKTLISKGVPRITPLFPMLSTQEHDVFYLVIGGRVDDVEGYQIQRVQLLLSVDTHKARVIFATQENCPKTLQSSRYILVINASQLVIKISTGTYLHHCVEHILSFINSNCIVFITLLRGCSR